MNYSEFYLQKKFDRFLDRPYKNVVDVGANVGIFTQYLLDNKLANHITAIECDPLALKDLKRNFETNPLVTVIDRALHYENKPVTFYHSPDNPIISSLLSPDMLKSHMAGRKGDVEITVDTITIQNLTDTIGEIDLLKIDIEGGEYSIIENITEDQVNFIHNIMIECHFFEEGYKSKYYQLIKKLENFGFSVEEFIENQSDNIGASEVIFARRVK
jgi:FkbM family methyltransferase